ncbi:unnamed protein product [Nippostrongylus brasiliensis]|uniref:Secreted phosphoprotein 1 n=1 Tax=Nippostrongylus brasiliensis TaxID=27835 RepID=A0A0N4YJB6_NIPBR|nr:unnamed protein product [Nippostrongylus brasiliensis]
MSQFFVVELLLLMATPSMYSDEVQPIEDVSAQSMTTPTAKQPFYKRKQDEEDCNPSLKKWLRKAIQYSLRTHLQYSKKADTPGPVEGIEDLDIVDSITDHSDDDSDHNSSRRDYRTTVEEHQADRLARDQPKKTSANTSATTKAPPKGKHREENVGRTEGNSSNLRSNSPPSPAHRPQDRQALAPTSRSSPLRRSSSVHRL